jgi:hypothetical protein
MTAKLCSYFWHFLCVHFGSLSLGGKYVATDKHVASRSDLRVNRLEPVN